jgi:RNA polymerase sigma factor (sigma-70 family)
MTQEQQTYLEQNYRAHESRLLGFIKSKISSAEESEDLLQDVFLQVMNNLNVFERIDNISGWLFTVARNKIIDRYRKKHLETIPLETNSNDDMNLAELLIQETESYWDEETQQLMNEAIMTAIDNLPDNQKYIFVQQVIEERTFRELSEETGESINTLLARKRYAVQTLRKELSELKQIIDE